MCLTFSSEEEDEKEWQERMNQKQALQVFRWFLNSECILLFEMNDMKMNISEVYETMKVPDEK